MTNNLKYFNLALEKARGLFRTHTILLEDPDFHCRKIKRLDYQRLCKHIVIYTYIHTWLIKIDNRSFCEFRITVFLYLQNIQYIAGALLKQMSKEEAKVTIQNYIRQIRQST